MAFGTPFICGKDILYNEFSYQDENGNRQTVAIPPSLLIGTALGQMENIEQSVTMDLKSPGYPLLLVGETKEELGGSHYVLVDGVEGCGVPESISAMAPGSPGGASCDQAGPDPCRHDLSEGGLAVARGDGFRRGVWHRGDA